MLFRSGLGFIAALNYKASPTRAPLNYKERNAVACELANISMPYVEIVTALRTIAS
mgnify:FL=1